MSATIVAPALPLYQQGFIPPRHARKFAHLARAPKVPLYLGGLGTGGQEIGLVAPIAAKAGSAIAAAAGAGSFAGPIGAGIGVLVGVIAGLWAGHEARVKGAKQENQAINSAVATFDSVIKAIFAAANSSNPTQNITAQQASQQVVQAYSTFFAQMAPYTHAPGAADASGGGANCGNGTLNPGGPCTGTPGGHFCNSSCTATCCVGCQDIYPTMLQAQQVFANPKGGSVQVCTVYGSKYGAALRSGYTLTYKPPVISVSSAASSILSDLTGGSSSGSILPIALLAIAAVMVLR